MAGSLLLGLIKPFLRDVLLNFDESSLSLSVLDGSGEIRDCEVNVDLINRLFLANVPMLKLLRCHVSQLRFRVPLGQMLGRPVRISIGEVFLEIGEPVDYVVSPEKPDAGQAPSHKPANYGFGDRIGDQLEIEVAKVTLLVRTQGILKAPVTGPWTPPAFGLEISNLHFFSVDEHFRQVSVSKCWEYNRTRRTDLFVHKRATLSLRLFLDVAEGSEGHGVGGSAQRDPAHVPKTSRIYLNEPADVVSLLVLHKLYAGNQLTGLQLEVRMQKLNLNLHATALRPLLHAMIGLLAMAMRCGIVKRPRSVEDVAATSAANARSSVSVRAGTQQQPRLSLTSTDLRSGLREVALAEMQQAADEEAALKRKRAAAAAAAAADAATASLVSGSGADADGAVCDPEEEAWLKEHGLSAASATTVAEAAANSVASLAKAAAAAVTHPHAESVSKRIVFAFSCAQIGVRIAYAGDDAGAGAGAGVGGESGGGAHRGALEVAVEGVVAEMVQPRDRKAGEMYGAVCVDRVLVTDAAPAAGSSNGSSSSGGTDSSPGVPLFAARRPPPGAPASRVARQFIPRGVREGELDEDSLAFISSTWRPALVLRPVVRIPAPAPPLPGVALTVDAPGGIELTLDAASIARLAEVATAAWDPRFLSGEWANVEGAAAAVHAAAAAVPGDSTQAAAAPVEELLTVATLSGVAAAAGQPGVVQILPGIGAVDFAFTCPRLSLRLLAPRESNAGRAVPVDAAAAVFLRLSDLSVAMPAQDPQLRQRQQQVQQQRDSGAFVAERTNSSRRKSSASSSNNALRQLFGMGSDGGKRRASSGGGLEWPRELNPLQPRVQNAFAAAAAAAATRPWEVTSGGYTLAPLAARFGLRSLTLGLVRRNGDEVTMFKTGLEVDISVRSTTGECSAAYVDAAHDYLLIGTHEEAAAGGGEGEGVAAPRPQCLWYYPPHLHTTLTVRAQITTVTLSVTAADIAALGLLGTSFAAVAIPERPPKEAESNASTAAPVPPPPEATAAAAAQGSLLPLGCGRFELDLSLESLSVCILPFDVSGNPADARLKPHLAFQVQCARFSVVAHDSSAPLLPGSTTLFVACAFVAGAELSAVGIPLLQLSGAPGGLADSGLAVWALRAADDDDALPAAAATTPSELEVAVGSLVFSCDLAVIDTFLSAAALEARAHIGVTGTEAFESLIRLVSRLVALPAEAALAAAAAAAAPASPETRAAAELLGLFPATLGGVLLDLWDRARPLCARAQASAEVVVAPPKLVPRGESFLRSTVARFVFRRLAVRLPAVAAGPINAAPGENAASGEVNVRIDDLEVRAVPLATGGAAANMSLGVAVLWLNERREEAPLLEWHPRIEMEVGSGPTEGSRAKFNIVKSNMTQQEGLGLVLYPAIDALNSAAQVGVAQLAALSSAAGRFALLLRAAKGDPRELYTAALRMGVPSLSSYSGHRLPGGSVWAPALAELRTALGFNAPSLPPAASPSVLRGRLPPLAVSSEHKQLQEELRDAVSAAAGGVGGSAGSLLSAATALEASLSLDAARQSQAKLRAALQVLAAEAGYAARHAGWLWVRGGPAVVHWVALVRRSHRAAASASSSSQAAAAASDEPTEGLDRAWGVVLKRRNLLLIFDSPAGAGMGAQNLQAVLSLQQLRLLPPLEATSLVGDDRRWAVAVGLAKLRDAPIQCLVLEEASGQGSGSGNASGNRLRPPYVLAFDTQAEEDQWRSVLSQRQAASVATNHGLFERAAVTLRLGPGRSDAAAITAAAAGATPNGEFFLAEEHGGAEISSSDIYFFTNAISGAVDRAKGVVCGCGPGSKNVVELPTVLVEQAGAPVAAAAAGEDAGAMRASERWDANAATRASRAADASRTRGPRAMSDQRAKNGVVRLLRALEVEVAGVVAHKVHRTSADLGPLSGIIYQKALAAFGTASHGPIFVLRVRDPLAASAGAAAEPAAAAAAAPPVAPLGRRESSSSLVDLDRKAPKGIAARMRASRQRKKQGRMAGDAAGSEAFAARSFLDVLLLHRMLALHLTSIVSSAGKGTNAAAAAAAAGSALDRAPVSLESIHALLTAGDALLAAGAFLSAAPQGTAAADTARWQCARVEDYLEAVVRHCPEECSAVVLQFLGCLGEKALQDALLRAAREGDRALAEDERSATHRRAPAAPAALGEKARSSVPAERRTVGGATSRATATPRSRLSASDGGARANRDIIDDSAGAAAPVVPEHPFEPSDVAALVRALPLGPWHRPWPEGGVEATQEGALLASSQMGLEGGGQQQQPYWDTRTRATELVELARASVNEIVRLRRAAVLARLQLATDAAEAHGLRTLLDLRAAAMNEQRQATSAIAGAAADRLAKTAAAAAEAASASRASEARLRLELYHASLHAMSSHAGIVPLASAHSNGAGDGSSPAAALVSTPVNLTLDERMANYWDRAFVFPAMKRKQQRQRPPHPMARGRQHQERGAEDESSHQRTQSDNTSAASTVHAPRPGVASVPLGNAAVHLVTPPQRSGAFEDSSPAAAAAAAAAASAAAVAEAAALREERNRLVSEISAVTLAKLEEGARAAAAEAEVAALREQLRVYQEEMRAQLGHVLDVDVLSHRLPLGAISEEEDEEVRGGQGAATARGMGQMGRVVLNDTASDPESSASASSALRRSKERVTRVFKGKSKWSLKLPGSNNASPANRQQQQQPSNNDSPLPGAAGGGRNDVAGGHSQTPRPQEGPSNTGTPRTPSGRKLKMWGRRAAPEEQP